MVVTRSARRHHLSPRLLTSAYNDLLRQRFACVSTSYQNEVTIEFKFVIPYFRAREEQFMVKIAIITGSTRPSRINRGVAEWVLAQVATRGDAE